MLSAGLGCMKRGMKGHAQKQAGEEDWGQSGSRQATAIGSHLV